MITDVNVHLSSWPTRRLPYDEPQRLVEKLQGAGVSQAWAGSFDALLHRDLANVNARVAAACREIGAGLLEPVGSINVTLPAWQEDVRRCVDEHRMRVLRVYPGYHDYPLSDVRFEELVRLCAERRRLLQVVVALEDERTQHPLLRASAADVRPLAELLPRHPQCHVILLNAHRAVRPDDLAALTTAANIHVDISNLEGVAGIEKLLRQVSHERIVFGSHFPFFQLEAALLKLRESALAGVQAAAITNRNAARLLETTQ